MKGYYFITDANLSRAGNMNDVQCAVRAGVKVIQYRNKESSTKRLYEEALQLKGLCRNVLFIINDRVDIALAVNADGIHLGQDDMPYEAARRLLGENRIIGVTVHNLEEAMEASGKGADYLGLSPIYPTTTKIDAGESCGIALIKEIKTCCSIPLVAVGGITLDNAPPVIQAGADSLCAISAVVSSDNVKEEIIKFQELFK
jgi:thiamine-phosphate pyrophosphorylase